MADVRKPITVSPTNGQAHWQMDTRWFHLLRAMISSGDLATLSGAAIKIYLAIKAATDISKGEAHIDQTTLMQQTGLSRTHLYRGLRELRLANYLAQEQAGRQNVYRILEKITIASPNGQDVGQASWAYVPGSMHLAMREVKEIVKREVLGDMPVVYITLQVNIAQDQATVNNFQESLDAIRDPELREVILRAIRHQPETRLP